MTEPARLEPGITSRPKPARPDQAAPVFAPAHQPAAMCCELLHDAYQGRPTRSDLIVLAADAACGGAAGVTGPAETLELIDAVLDGTPVLDTPPVRLLAAAVSGALLGAAPHPAAVLDHLVHHATCADHGGCGRVMRSHSAGTDRSSIGAAVADV